MYKHDGRDSYGTLIFLPSIKIPSMSLTTGQNDQFRVGFLSQLFFVSPSAMIFPLSCKVYRIIVLLN